MPAGSDAPGATRRTSFRVKSASRVYLEVLIEFKRSESTYQGSHPSHTHKGIQECLLFIDQGIHEGAVINELEVPASSEVQADERQLSEAVVADVLEGDAVR